MCYACIFGSCAALCNKYVDTLLLQNDKCIKYAIIMKIAEIGCNEYRVVFHMTGREQKRCKKNILEGIKDKKASNSFSEETLDKSFLVCLGLPSRNNWTDRAENLTES